MQRKQTNKKSKDKPITTKPTAWFREKEKAGVEIWRKDKLIASNTN